VKHLAEFLEEEGVTFIPEHQHIRCMAHVINLSAQELLSKLKADPICDNEEDIVKEKEKSMGSIVAKVFYIFLFFKKIKRKKLTK
jgi:hypothetical protein